MVQRHSLTRAALVVVSAAATASCDARTVNVSNVLPRRDTSGAIMDMHDGNVHVGEDGTYYWYAAGYGVRPCTRHTSPWFTAPARKWPDSRACAAALHAFRAASSGAATQAARVAFTAAGSTTTIA